MNSNRAFMFSLPEWIGGTNDHERRFNRFTKLICRRMSTQIKNPNNFILQMNNNHPFCYVHLDACIRSQYVL